MIKVACDYADSLKNEGTGRLCSSYGGSLSRVSLERVDLRRRCDPSFSDPNSILIPLLSYHRLAATLISYMACFHEKRIPPSLFSEDASKIKVIRAVGIQTGYSFVKKQTANLRFQKCYLLWWVPKKHAQLIRIIPRRNVLNLAPG